ncbi:MAG: glycerol-1-phosphate dehydrogenase, partial [Nitrosopumilus sp.]|nr:glycerol-1-phosphate dehydrogenase [Nitrosopumilus sp.]
MRKNEDHMKSHTMELPRLIEIGEKNIGSFGKFLNSLNKPKKVSLISGINVQKVLKTKIEKSLKIKKIQFVWHTSINNQIKSINKIEKDVRKDNSNLI